MRDLFEGVVPLDYNKESAMMGSSNDVVSVPHCSSSVLSSPEEKEATARPQKPRNQRGL